MNTFCTRFTNLEQRMNTGEKSKRHPTEYIVVTDLTSKIVLSTEDHQLAINFANKVRACGGQVTIFKSMKA